MATTKPPAEHKLVTALPYVGVFILWLSSLILSLQQTNEAALKQYDLTESSLHTIQIILSFPALFIWVTLLYAFLSFYRYARQIAGSPDSPGFKYIAWGLGALLSSFILTNFLRQIRGLLAENSANPDSIDNTFIILTNYVSVVAAFLAYLWIYKGSRSLLASIKVNLTLPKNMFRFVIPFAVLAAVYLTFIFINPERRISTHENINPTYALPDLLILITVAIPYLVAWWFAILALIGLYRYKKLSTGIIYKSLFDRLLKGLTALISLTIFLQLLTQFTAFLAQSGLNSILGIITVLYIVLVGAFIAVGRAAQQLNKIETFKL
jgi:hypothetical protein